MFLHSIHAIAKMTHIRYLFKTLAGPQLYRLLLVDVH